jgi:hypothetical protein
MQNKPDIKVFTLHFYRSDEEVNDQPVLYAVVGTREKKQRKRPFYVPVVYKGTLDNFKQFGNCVSYGIEIEKPKDIPLRCKIGDDDYGIIEAEVPVAEKYYYHLDNSHRLVTGSGSEDAEIKYGFHDGTYHGTPKIIKLHYIDNIELTVPYPDETAWIKYLNEKIKKHEKIAKDYQDADVGPHFSEKQKKSLVRKNTGYVNHCIKLLGNDL